MKDRSITVNKASVHNLQQVNIKLKPGLLYVFTGVSGSGKSSLAFDTLYAEGQRRYVESLSAFARRYLGELSKPQIESAHNLSPTISIEQKTSGRNPRSTVGTMTEIYDYLRVLFARVATAYCPISQEPVSSQSKERIISTISSLKENSKILLLAPFAKGKKGEFLTEFEFLSRKGFTKVRVDGEILSLDNPILLDGSVAHNVDIVIDRIKIQKSELSRIAESVTLALEMGQGVLISHNIDTNEETLYSLHAFSFSSGKSYEALEPHDFSFNSIHGMCQECQGLGYSDKDASKTCLNCKGSRIRSYPAAARFKGKKIHEITSLTIDEALLFFTSVQLEPSEQLIAKELIKEIKERLSFLQEVGLNYLTLNRSAPTLSGGEAQRVRLASQIGSGLVGVTYILDEPSIGLHPRDNTRLIKTLKQLRDKGNTVIVVEHDEETIFMADQVVDFGPGPGVLGGHIIFQGSVEGLLKCKESLTGQYLSGKLSIAVPQKRRSSNGSYLEIIGAKENNLQNVDLKIPLGQFIAVTGVSGSGKSTLIFDILYPFLSNHLHKSKLHLGKCREIKGIEHIDKVICIDQKPIGRTPRSNPSTYIKLFDDIRNLFSELPDSLSKGFLPGRFSFNVKEGSCPSCSGMGMIKLDMDFMEDCWTPCTLCEGRRFDEETLSIQYRGKSISEILEFSVDEALEFFHALPTIRKKLEVLQKVGLGYMKIGQPSPTLSGGEAQRIKLAKELVRPSTGRTLYLFDEPTTGLHFHDVNKLLQIMQELTDKGNTLIVIEHNMDVVKVADFIIDLGPEGGKEGGKIIAFGTPEKIAKMDSATGRELKIYLNKSFAIQSDHKKGGSLFESSIIVKEASEHNLKKVSVEIPREKITICTGPSGSGKSSLAFDTIYAEGQRRYTESLSPYARQFVTQMPKPKVGFIDGLSPAIAIEQKASAGNPRSTVGTLTEVYDYLRILFARLGVAYCPETKEEIRSISKEFVADKLMSMKSKTPLYITAPIEISKSESFDLVKDKLIKKGYVRIILNGTLYELDEEIPFERGKKNKLYLVTDRLKISQEIRGRLLEAIDSAASISKGVIVALYEENNLLKELFFNLSFAVLSTGKSYPPITPKSFAFNVEDGMCQDCQGLGTQYGIDFAKFDEFKHLTTDDLFSYFLTHLPYSIFSTFLEEEKIDIDDKLADLTDRQWQLLMNGSDKEYKFRKQFTYRWKGLNNLLSLTGQRGFYPDKYLARQWLKEITCPSCNGSRLNPLSSHVQLEKKTIKEIISLSIDELQPFISSIKIPKDLKPILNEAMDQISSRLSFMMEVGLSYLSLDRTAPTLSNGEAQRIRLARQLGSGLTGVLYVLDEPTIGLHPQEIDRLNQALIKLKNLGNTLLIVEHDPQTIQIADYLIDMGPKAGIHGGQVMAAGTLKEIKKNPNSLTGAYLSSRKKIEIPLRKIAQNPYYLQIERANKHNLKSLNISFPIGRLSCITGPSGSGKSTLLHGVIKPLVESALLKTDSVQNDEGKISGISQFDKLIYIDQDPIGQTIRSDVLTYIELLGPIREFFSALPKAKMLGLMPRHFSYNVKAGMCMECKGLGHKKIEMQFLPPVIIECPDCKGARLNKKSLLVTYMDKNFGNILQLTVDEALILFNAHPKMKRLLMTLQAVGLGYLTLGQEVQTLSGGEAQRLKLSYELSKRSQGKTLYLIDEPTTGLHSDDIVKLLEVLKKLLDLGNTMILIEHNLDVIKCADYIVDLGPQSGEKGGYIVAEGSIKDIINNKASITGPYLKELLK